MSVLTAALKSIVLTLTLEPASTPLLAVTIALGLVAAWFGFSKITTALKFPMNTGWRPMGSLALLLLLCLSAAVLAKAYVSPRISSSTLSRFMPLIVAVVIYLAVVVPLSCFFMKSHYIQTMSAFLVPIIAAAVVAFLIKGAAGAIKHGGKGFSSTKERTEGIDEALSK
jgi:hypothetical protein